MNRANQAKTKSVKPIRVVIIDDEWLVRVDLKAMLADYPELEVVGEANNFKNAIQVINDLKPDVVFLDIQLPGGSGFELLESEQLEVSFKVIFITAYDEYALQALEVNALDYLLKPIHPNRLAQAIRRLLE